MNYLKMLEYHIIYILITLISYIHLSDGVVPETQSHSVISAPRDNSTHLAGRTHFRRRVSRRRHPSCPSLCHCSRVSVTCSGRKHHQLPTALNRNLEYFKMTKTRLNRIKSSDFVRMFSLHEIHLGGNAIEAIDGWSFKDLISLEVLNLTNNRLRHIDTTAFKHLVATKELYLDHNRLVGVEGVVSYLANLVTLDLSNNKLTSISNKTFYGNAKVTKLDLSKNLLRFIDRNAFTRMTSLTTLLLNENPLAELNLFLESNLLLEQLDLTKCHLKRVVRDTPKQLKDLRLANNKIRVISELDFINPNAIIMLLLSNNRIQRLSNYAFKYMPHMQDLYINKNRLKSLPLHMPRKLISIHASHNRITVLNSKAFKNKYKLKFIFLKFNKISRIESGAFKKLPRLKQLDMSHNNINTIASDLFWRTTNLEILDLSFNPIHLFEPNCFLSTASLHILKASSVEGSIEMDVNPFADLHNLHYLDLSYSPTIASKLIHAPSFGGAIASVQSLNIMGTGLLKLSRRFRNVMKNLSFVNMIHNPWRCNRNILWVRDWIRDNTVNFYEAPNLVCHSPLRLKDRSLIGLSNDDVKKKKKKRKKSDESKSKVDDLSEDSADIQNFRKTLHNLDRYIYEKAKQKPV